MRRFFLAVLCVLAGVLPATGVKGDGEPAEPRQYKMEMGTVRTYRDRNTLYVTVEFKVLRASDGKVATDVNKDEIVVKEDGQVVANLEISQPKTDRLTTVLAMDVSGSMEGRSQSGSERKIDEAKQAARAFLDGLHARADTGLVLFDNEMKVQEEPGKDPTKFAQHRQEVRRLIDAAEPSGGTAYLDATDLALRMVKPFPGRKAVLVMTDGVDMNSKRKLDDVIAHARAIGVPVYTLGIGDPGKNEPVTTVMVLDHSGSMRGKANDTDKVSKIEALHAAGARFVDLMRPNARTTLLPFSTNVEMPMPFSTDKEKLKERISQLQPEGGTLLYDATYAGIEALMADRAEAKAAKKPEGKRALVVMTDGKDEAPGSRCSDQVVIDRAREAGIPLYMLGLGRKSEINEAVMTRMAEATGGKYHHAGNQQRLIELFEKLSIDIHDDGIDETSLRELAEETGGKYIPVRDASKLKLEFGRLSDELQSTYTVTFPSRKQTHDGTARGIDIQVVRGGVAVSDTLRGDYNVRGVVVPEMDYKVYLVLLAVLAGLLVFPAGLRRLSRPGASS